MVGKTLGHYEIIKPLGAGGMGEVYRARDTKLDRDVAIKVLPEDFASDPDRLARFEREAKLLAALSHANIGSIYGLEASDGVRFLVLELIEGESLEQRLRKGAIPVRESLDIARQIAEALEAAHDVGIIHRDVKPANVLLTGRGGVKVLDFGIAKSTVLDAATDAALTEQATSLTIDGTLMGTPPYMAPEQIRGEEADKRADIWAFGCVLYEMLTGRGAFVRETVADTLAAVLQTEPDWAALPDRAPSSVALLLERCMRKETNRRLRDIGDARIEIEEAIEGPGEAPIAATLAETRTPRWVPVAIALALLLGAAASYFGISPPALERRYVDITLPEGTWLWGGQTVEARMGYRPSRHAFSLAPDGKLIVFSATDGTTSRLYRRSLVDSSFEALPIPGTEGGTSPVVSPDGQSVAFTVLRDVKVAPLQLGSGQVRTVLDDAEFGPQGFEQAWWGLSWGEDGSIYITGNLGELFRISPGANSPQELRAALWPAGFRSSLHSLPGDDALLYTAWTRPSYWSSARVIVERLDGAPVDLELPGCADARYVPTDHLVFACGGSLWAAGFDPARPVLTSAPVRMLEDVMQATRITSDWMGTGSAQYSFASASGDLAFATGGTYPEPEPRLVWVTRDGDKVTFPRQPADHTTSLYARISPDGRYIAYSGPRLNLLERDIIVLEIETGAWEAIPLEGLQWYPVWSADSKRLAFQSAHEGGSRDLYWIGVDDLRTATPERILPSGQTGGSPHDWLSGDVLVYEQGNRIRAVRVGGSDEPLELATGRFPAISPDERWLAYESDGEINVRRYPGGSRDYPVTQGDGGLNPAWARDGRELFYRTDGVAARSRMMSVAFDPDEGPTGDPELLFDMPMGGSSGSRSYDVAADAHFLMMDHWEYPDQRVTELRIVLNWYEELSERVPTGGR